ncbi:MAG: hypothetical protein DI531_08000 [Brevundimonas sp.]|uniref:hypothetical protein n=1 Tax=Brevundimonas sp. TaxID=1871086 RepID=UPI000DB67859|nr:hypothetical protein [Brevundimonas sp.]PZU74104.1 MAG: hypothetical protein DI531_08000 [Brevundimonas sp.]
MLSPPIDFDWLKALHREKRLQLTFGVGMQGFVAVNNDPQALVTEILRLAEIGQKLEIETAATVRRLDA